MYQFVGESKWVSGFIPYLDNSNIFHIILNFIGIIYSFSFDRSSQNGSWETCYCCFCCMVHLPRSCVTMIRALNSPIVWLEAEIGITQLTMDSEIAYCVTVNKTTDWEIVFCWLYFVEFILPKPWLQITRTMQFLNCGNSVGKIDCWNRFFSLYQRVRWS